MSKKLQSSTTEVESTDAQTQVTGGAALSSDALARRRMLLKSIGKGSSVVAIAAAGSIHTLAGGGTLTFTASGSRCTMSGTVSGIHSKDTTKGTCAGNSPSHYNTIAKWPPFNNSTNYKVGTCTFTSTSNFKSVFGTGSTANSLLAIVTSNTDSEAVWITALLNSLPSSGASNFPYTPDKVVALYKSTTDNAGALKFFKDYMQTIA